MRNVLKGTKQEAIASEFLVLVLIIKLIKAGS